MPVVMVAPAPSMMTPIPLVVSAVGRFALGKVPAFSWHEIQDPENHTTICLSRAWVQASGHFFAEHFPFWFADTWLKEVYGFVYGSDMPIIEQMKVSHKRAPTQNMHDLEFWFRVFAQTRGERIEEAKRIAKAIGAPWHDRPALVALFEQGDALQIERVPQYEAFYKAGSSAPSAAYLEAKAKAEKLFNVRDAFAEAA